MKWTGFHSRSLHGRIVGLVLIALALGGCSILSFIEDRLPPPEATQNGVIFRYKAPAARQVNLAGEFNNWLGTANCGRLDPNIDPMRDLDGDGIWEITLPLPPGRYQYKFVIDQVDWQEDPGNPETTDAGYGGQNSILVVPADVSYTYDEAYVTRLLGTGSRIRILREHTFTLEGYADADKVFASGSFADWDPVAHQMILDADGIWRVTVELPEGQHLYKFVVDGEWIADPANDQTRDDGYGGQNSVLFIRP
jgi:1,4-alpha-glucan branching enzyme